MGFDETFCVAAAECFKIKKFRFLYVPKFKNYVISRKLSIYRSLFT